MASRTRFRIHGSHPLFVTRSQDLYGNGVEYLRATDGTLTGFVHHVGSQTRTITYSRNATQVTVAWSENGVPARIWHYVFGDLGLTDIQPPTGPAWHFDYATGPYVIRVTTPTGGVVGYQMAMHYGPNSEYPPHQPLYHSLHLMSRTEVASGATWSFTYVDGDGGEVTSRVTLPDSLGVQDYMHMRDPDGGYAGRRYLNSVVTCNRPPELPGPPAVCAGTTYGWKTLDAVGDALPMNPNGNGDGAYTEDPAPQLIGQVTAFRDGRTYDTLYHYCGEAGEPACTVVTAPRTISATPPRCTRPATSSGPPS